MRGGLLLAAGMALACAASSVAPSRGQPAGTEPETGDELGAPADGVTGDEDDARSSWTRGDDGETPADTATSERCAGPPPAPGYECVRDCGPPVVRAGDPQPGWSWLSSEQARSRERFGCPICLPADAPIDTPRGPVAIARLRAGAIVWGVDEAGRRVATRVAHVASSIAPIDHAVVVVELADGRVVRASPGHPDSEGRALGDRKPGDVLDGSRVVGVSRQPYTGRTYDLALEPGRSRYVSGGVPLTTSLPARP